MFRRLSILVPLATTALFACADRVEWSADDLENASHFFAAAEADIVATRVSTSNRAGPMTEADRKQILAHKRQALEQARAVRDEILEKALTGLSGPFREKFQRSLELQIANLQSGDLDAELEGSRLHDEWVEFINSQRDRIRIPREPTG